MPKKFKVWLQVEQITYPGDDTVEAPEDYEDLGEPIDVECASEEHAFRIQMMLQEIGNVIVKSDKSDN